MNISQIGFSSLSVAVGYFLGNQIHKSNPNFTKSQARIIGLTAGVVVGIVVYCTWKDEPNKSSAGYTNAIGAAIPSPDYDRNKYAGKIISPSPLMIPDGVYDAGWMNDMLYIVAIPGKAMVPAKTDMVVASPTPVPYKVLISNGTGLILPNVTAYQPGALVDPYFGYGYGYPTYGALAIINTGRGGGHHEGGHGGGGHHTHIDGGGHLHK